MRPPGQGHLGNCELFDPEHLTTTVYVRMC